MIAQGAMAFNSRCLPSGDPYGVPQIVVTLKSFRDSLRASAMPNRGGSAQSLKIASGRTRRNPPGRPMACPSLDSHAAESPADMRFIPDLQQVRTSAQVCTGRGIVDRNIRAQKVVSRLTPSRFFRAQHVDSSFQEEDRHDMPARSVTGHGRTS
jgi:hypothetical protein